MGTAGVSTFLFTEIAGSAPALDRLGDDAYERLHRLHLHLLKEAVAAHGGHEVRSLGNGLFVAFPAAADALAAAIRLQRAAERYNRAGPDRLGIRIGLNVGEPIVDESDYFGRPVVTAQRLCEIAGRDQILAVALIRDLVDRQQFSMKELPPQILRGMPEPRQALEVVWQQSPTSTSALPPELHAAAAALLVARDAELQRIDDAWKEAAAGRSRTLVVAGEPGVGKTRLVAEAASRASRAGALVLYGGCDEDLGLPYQPFVEALGGYVRSTNADAIRSQGGPRLGELVRLLPDLAELVPGLPPPVQGSPDLERYWLFESVLELLAGVTRDQPLVLVVDDLHWATKPTLLLLRHIVRSPQPSSLLILGTYRDTELDRTHPLAEFLAEFHRAGVERLQLRGLDPAGVSSFLRAAAGDAELDERVEGFAVALHAETDGNPFFVSEVLAHLVESGALYEQGGRWTAAANARLEDLGLPDSVRDVISRRVARLSETANQVLVVASVAGTSFSVPLLEAVCDLDTDGVLDALEEAADAGLLIESRGGFTFAHALVRQTLYSQLSGIRRGRLHGRIGEAMEALPAAEQETGALALHFGRAARVSVPEKAAAYALAAGQRAIARLAFEEAIPILGQGLEALAELPKQDLSLRSDLWLALAEARRGSPLITIDEAQAAADAGARDAVAVGSSQRLARAALLHHLSIHTATNPRTGELLEQALEAVDDDAKALRAQLLAALAHHRAYGEARVMAGESLARDALRLGQELGDPVTVERALFSLEATLAGTPDQHARLEVLEQLANAAIEANDPTMQAIAVFLRCEALLTLGERQVAQDAVRGIDALARQISWADTRVNADAWRTLLALLDGRFQEAETIAGEWYQRSPQGEAWLLLYGAEMAILRWEQGRLEEFHVLASMGVENTPQSPLAIAALCVAEAETGRLEEADARARAFLRSGFLPVERSAGWPWLLSLLSTAAALTRDPEIAGTLRPHLAPYGGLLVVLPSAVACAGAVDRYRGMVATTLGDFDDAEVQYRSAMELEQRIGSMPNLARTRLWYARMLVERAGAADREDAAQLAATTLSTAEQLGMDAVATAARQLLGAVG